MSVLFVFEFESTVTNYLIEYAMFLLFKTSTITQNHVILACSLSLF